jgi:3-hydroxyisobutyrate dehydrogenase-like beta-hydroxyacid dehydrogenase
MSVGIECLLTDDAGRAAELARRLDDLNRERRDIEAGMRDQAEAVVAGIELSEAAAITQAHGVHLERLLTALDGNANYSTLIGMKLPAIMNGDFEPHFSLSNMLKDADFARELAAEFKIESPALNVTAEAMRRGVEAGEGDLDFSVIGRR